MNQTIYDLLNVKQSDLPKRIPHLINRNADYPNYEYNTQTWLIRAKVGDGLLYFRYTSLKDTPERVTQSFELDLACISVTVDAMVLEFEDDF